MRKAPLRRLPGRQRLCLCGWRESGCVICHLAKLQESPHLSVPLYQLADSFSIPSGPTVCFTGYEMLLKLL